MKNVKKIDVLWTGGYDSTFRIAELSKEEVEIQPYYLSDNRKSEQNELQAIKEITNIIKRHPETKATILPLLTYNTVDIKPDEKITQSYNKIRKSLALGSQYDWLARFAKENNLDSLELGLEKAESSIARQTIKMFGEVKLVEDYPVSYYVIDEEKSSKGLIDVLGRFHLPKLLYESTKQEVLSEYKKLNLESIIDKTWFCHKPINNEPCGYCNPCISVVEEGMDFRLSKKALHRYRFQYIYKGIDRIKNKVTRF